MASRERFVYEEYDAKTVKGRANQSGGFDHYLVADTPRYKVSDGANNLRVLPAGWVKNEKLVKKWGKWWAIEIWIHSFIGPDNANFLCPNKMLGKRCPLCEARHDIDPEDEEALRNLKPTKRALCYVIDRDEEKAGVQSFAMPASKVEKELASRSTNKKTGEILRIDNPEEGYDITFEKSGTGLKTQYIGVDIDRESSPLSDNEKRMDKWLAYITEHPLPEILFFHDVDYMEKVYMGKASKKDENDDDDDDDDKKKKRKSRDDDDDDDDDKDSKKSKRKSRDDDDDDDDDEPKKKKKSLDDDDDVDFDEPKKKRKSRDDDDDGEDDDDEPKKKKRSRDDDDDEDEKPKRKSRDTDDDDDDDDEPKKKKKSSDDDDDDDDAGKSSKSKRKSRDDDDDDDEPKKKKRSSDDDNDDDDASSKSKKSMDRLKKRHSKDEDDD